MGITWNGTIVQDRFLSLLYSLKIGIVRLNHVLLELELKKLINKSRFQAASTYSIVSTTHNYKKRVKSNKQIRHIIDKPLSQMNDEK
jgi:hypothetical protein